MSRSNRDGWCRCTASRISNIHPLRASWDGRGPQCWVTWGTSRLLRPNVVVLYYDRRDRVFRAVRSPVEASITSGTRPGRVLLIGVKALPPVGRIASMRERAERKCLTALHREGRHDIVLRATAHLNSSPLSILPILRAC